LLFAIAGAVVLIIGKMIKTTPASSNPFQNTNTTTN
jgi:hypothetical protein